PVTKAEPVKTLATKPEVKANPSASKPPGKKQPPPAKAPVTARVVPFRALNRSGVEGNRLQGWPQETVAHFPAHPAPLTALAISPDGELVACGSRASAEVRLWEMTGAAPSPCGT